MRRWVCLVAAVLVGCAERAPEAGSRTNATDGSRGASKEDKSAAPSAAAGHAAPLPPPIAREEGKGDPSLALRAPTRSFSEFRPSEHGFGFANDFSGEVVPLGRQLGLPSRFGLCGGMSFAAADYYLALRAVPEQTKPPLQGTGLYNYLYMRQAASNGVLGSMGVKFLEWMQLSDEEVRERTRAEIPGIVEAVKRGEPVVIGEVLQNAAAKGGKAWENHQVLAYGVEEAAGGAGEMRIRIYDPNFPRKDDVVIRVREDGYARVGGGRREMVIRGFFRMGYERVEPK